MNNFKVRLKKRALNKNTQVHDAPNAYMRTFKEMPSVDNTGPEHAGRINPYDLFSHYTADIIREDIVFTR